MKKALVLIAVLGFAFATQAQIGNLIGSAVKKGIEKSVEKKVEQTVEQKTDELLGKSDNTATNNQEQGSANEASASTSEKDGVPTPEEVMAMVPKMPTFQNIADYLCEQSRENPRTLKMLANPTTTFLAKMAVTLANGYVTMFAGENTIYALDAQLLDDLGITQEEYDAMTEEEQQALAQRYAAELEERYVRTTNALANDKRYTKMVEEYNTIEDQIRELQTKAEATCHQLWSDKHAASGNICDYYRDAVPECYKAVLQGLQMRKETQLDVAKRIDDYVAKLAKEKPHEVFTGFFNYAGLCATAYVTDAALVTSIPDPR